MPVVVTTVPTLQAIAFPFQRKTFGCAGRLWIFYTDGLAMLWAHSADYGATWVVPSSSTVVTKSPSSYPVEIWDLPDRAFALDGLDAQGWGSYGRQDWGGYGFTVPSDAVVSKVRIRIDAFFEISAMSINIYISWDGGTTWGPAHLQALTPTLATYWIDVTADTDWTPNKVNNLMVGARPVGAAGGLINLDWIPVEVTYYSTQAVRPAILGDEFSVWCDGTYVHYAHSSEAVNSPLHYRRGLLNSDGSITWSAPEQNAVDADASASFKDHNISTDNDGYPWISYSRLAGTSALPYVTKSSLNDGTWQTQAGFPFQLTSSVQTRWTTSILPLTQNKMYALYVYSPSTFKGRLWDGSSWGSEEAVSTGLLYQDHAWSAITYADDVHLAYVESTETYDLKYVKRTWGVGWGPDLLLVTPGAVQGAPQLVLFRSGDLYYFWIGEPVANTVFFARNINGVWDSLASQWFTEPNGITADKFTCFFQAYDPGTETIYIGLAYLTEIVPHELKFDRRTVLVGIAKGDGLFWTIR